jgi:hypothetical protein
LDFFGVMPDLSVRRIDLGDEADPEMEDVFEKDIDQYRQLETKDFYPDYTPTRGAENFKVDDFKLPTVMERGMGLWHSRDPLLPQDIRPHGVKAIVGVETERTDPDDENERGQRIVKLAAFKRLDRSRIIDQSVLRIFWDKGTFDKIDGPGMTVPEGLDALYEDGTLYFSSHRTASGFLDLTNIFNEASAPQIDEVMSQDILIFTGEGTIHDFVNSTCKRAISMLHRSGRMSGLKVRDIKEQAEAYGIELQLDGSGEAERIVVPETNRSFKELLDLLNQNYFPGIFDGEHYVANSKRPI